MAAFDQATLDRWRALAIVDRDGATVGTIGEFYLDRETGHPTWALVNTGLFGASQTFVPLVHAVEISDGLQVPYEKGHIKDAPKVDLHDELSPDEEAALFAHYGVDYQPSPEAPGGVDEGPAPDGPDVTADAVPEPGEAPGTFQADPGPGEPPGPVPAEPGSVDATGPVDTGQGSTPPDPGQLVPDEPGTSEADEAGYRPDPDAADGAVPDEPGTGAPDQAAPADPDLARTAPVEPGLPGSTAASPYGPGPTTIDKDTGAAEHPPDEPLRVPGEAGWAPRAAGGIEEHEPVDRPAGASDRWREAKLAAERDRIARAAATPSEERSPLERARRRLERLVGVGQEAADPEDISPADRDAAERARLARLGQDEDDHRRP